MTITCEEVQREISNYLDEETSENLGAAIDEHLQGCKHCKAVLDGIHNVVRLYGDERMTEMPPGFSHRLHQMLDANMPGSRRRFFGWIVGAAATIAVAGSIKAGRSAMSDLPRLRTEHAQTNFIAPPDLRVVASTYGKLFHLPACPFIHDRAHSRNLTAGEAMKEGYTPCVRCMKNYLRA